MMARIGETLRRREPVPIYLLILIIAAITTTWAIGIFGAVRYFSDLADAQARDNATTRYLAERARYENDRDEFILCGERVANTVVLARLADDVAAMGEVVGLTFVEVRNLIQNTEAAAELRASIDNLLIAVGNVSESASEYEPVDPTTCPRRPVPPVPPEPIED